MTQSISSFEDILLTFCSQLWRFWQVPWPFTGSQIKQPNDAHFRFSSLCMPFMSKNYVMEPFQKLKRPLTYSKWWKWSLPNKTWLEKEPWCSLLRQQHCNARSHIFFGYFSEERNFLFPHQQALILAFTNRLEINFVWCHRHHFFL